MKTRLARILAVLVCSTLLGLGGATLTACGDDEGTSGLKRGGKKKRRGKRGGDDQRGKRGKGGKGGKLEGYDKVPDEYRHKFAERDFVPDLTGDENRNPFRSYVVNNTGTRRRTEEKAIDVTEICTKENSVAPTYSLRDLRLIGIVLRGTRSYALFRDSGAFGHIVRRGDCLGKEQARVDSIGAGFVRLTVIPEAPPGAPAPAPQTRDISLHPEEITLEPEGSGVDEE